MNFRASFCDPFKPDIIELGDIKKENVMETFNQIPWKEYLDKMDNAGDREIHFSPSFELENKDNKNGLAISAIDGVEWYIFFKRPKRVKSFFGLSEKVNENYLTDVQGQTESDVRACLEALLRNDLQFLEDKVK